MAYWPSEHIGCFGFLIQIAPGGWIAVGAYDGLPPANRTLPRLACLDAERASEPGRVSDTGVRRHPNHETLTTEVAGDPPLF